MELPNVDVALERTAICVPSAYGKAVTEGLCHLERSVRLFLGAVEDRGRKAAKRWEDLRATVWPHSLEASSAIGAVMSSARDDHGCCRGIVILSRSRADLPKIQMDGASCRCQIISERPSLPLRSDASQENALPSLSV